MTIKPRRLYFAIIDQLKKSLPSTAEVLYLDVTYLHHPTAIIKMGGCYSSNIDKVSADDWKAARRKHKESMRIIKSAVAEAKEQLHEDNIFINITRLTANVYCQCTEVSRDA